jgi:hypothetical protein
MGMGVGLQPNASIVPRDLADETGWASLREGAGHGDEDADND